MWNYFMLILHVFHTCTCVQVLCLEDVNGMYFNIISINNTNCKFSNTYNDLKNFLTQ